MLAFPKPKGNPQRKRRDQKQRAYNKAKRDMADQILFCRRCGSPHNIEAHHEGGRDGERMSDPGNLAPLCHDCHMWVHAHPLEARELGLTARRNGS